VLARATRSGENSRLIRLRHLTGQRCRWLHGRDEKRVTARRVS